MINDLCSSWFFPYIEKMLRLERLLSRYCVKICASWNLALFVFFAVLAHNMGANFLENIIFPLHWDLFIGT